MIAQNYQDIPTIVWKGNTFFNFRGYFDYNWQRYARFRAETNEPETSFLTFDLPEKEIQNLSLPDTSKRSMFYKQRRNYNFPESSRGYEIITKGKRARLLKVSLDGKIIYDSM